MVRGKKGEEYEEREWGTVILMVLGFVLLAIGLGVYRGDFTFFTNSNVFFIAGALCVLPMLIKGIIGLVVLIGTRK